MIPSKLEILKSISFFPIEKIYTYANDESNHEYDKVCNKSAIKLLKDTMQTLAIIIISVTIFSIFPAVASFQNDEIQFMIPILFPFTDLKSQTGIIVNMLHQLVTGVISMTGNIGIEVLNCILKNAVWSSANAVCYSIDELSPILKKSKQVPSKIIDYRFRNIVLQVQDIDRYTFIFLIIHVMYIS